MLIKKNKLYQYIFLLILTFMVIFNGGNNNLYIQFILAVLMVFVAVLVSPVPTSIRRRTFLHPFRPGISFNPGPGEILLPSKDYRFIFNFYRSECLAYAFMKLFMQRKTRSQFSLVVEHPLCKRKAEGSIPSVG